MTMAGLFCNIKICHNRHPAGVSHHHHINNIVYCIKQFFIIFYLIFILFISCLNNKSPHGNTIIRLKPEIVTIDIMGYGFSKGKSKTGTEMWAKNEAQMSIAYQVKGIPFSWSSYPGGIVFSTETDEVELAFSQIRQKEIWNSQDQWAAFIVMESKTEAEIHAGGGMVIEELSVRSDDVTTALHTLQMQAVEKALKRLPQTKKKKGEITGRIFISKIDAVPDKEADDVELNALFTIIFD
jgi:hypothetical protein